MQFGHLIALLGSFVAVAMTAPTSPTNELPAAVLESADFRYVELRANSAEPVRLQDYGAYQFPALVAESAYCGLKVGSKVGDARIRWSGGDGTGTPRDLVAYSPSRGVIVAHQGTNSSSLDSVLKDVHFELVDADRRLSYLGKGVKIHKGFQTSFLETADTVVSEVKALLAVYPNAPVLTVGHSLGASIALLDALYLKNEFPKNKVSSVTFGLPRTGNTHFANAVDANLAGFVHINNGRDPVPRLPGGALGFQQPSGEIWINPANGFSAVICAGQENKHCSLSVNPLRFHVADHTGTYFGVRISGGGGCQARR